MQVMSWAPYPVNQQTSGRSIPFCFQIVIKNGNPGNRPRKACASGEVGPFLAQRPPDVVAEPVGELDADAEARRKWQFGDVRTRPRTGNRGRRACRRGS